MNREVIIVGGMTGWGKSLWAKCYAAPCRRLFVYDPAMSFPDVRFDGEQGGYADYLEQKENEDFAGLRFAVPGTSEPIGVPKKPNEDQASSFRVGVTDAENCESLGGSAWMEGHCLLVLEEASTVFEKGQSRLPEWMSAIIFRGRHQAVSLLVIAQRFMSIPRDIRSQASRVVSFNQHEEDDIHYLKSVFKGDAAEIPNLEKWECLDRCGTQTYRYSIFDRVQDVLGIKLDRDQEPAYSAFYKS